MASLWSKFVRAERNLTDAVRQALRLIDVASHRANEGVKTRQVLRAEARRTTFRKIKEDYGGEPRRSRRKMTLRIAARNWREAVK